MRYNQTSSTCLSRAYSFVPLASDLVDLMCVKRAFSNNYHHGRHTAFEQRVLAPLPRPLLEWQIKRRLPSTWPKVIPH